MFEKPMFEEPMSAEPMFADCMLGSSWAQRTRRSWTTLTSFGLQAVVIGLLLLSPLLTNVGLPSGHALPTAVSWGAPPPAAPPVQRQHAATIVQSNVAENNVLIAPPSIPRHVAMIEEPTAPPQVSYSPGGVAGETGDGSAQGVWGALNDLSHTAPPPVPVPVPPVRQFRTSHMLEGNLIRKVQPAYPPLARSARIQGAVVLAAVISKEGAIENLQALSGHPMLVPAAIDAVRQWRYRPYILNSEPIEVETRIIVNFTLAGN